MDLKLFDELADCFTDEASCWFDGGAATFAGRDAIVGFIRSSTADTNYFSSHVVSHPEITLSGRDDARGIWRFEHTTLMIERGITTRGAGYYFDEYAKADGRWRIHSTGFRRIFAESASRTDASPPRLIASWWHTDGRSAPDLEVPLGPVPADYEEPTSSWSDAPASSDRSTF
jgi:hypothetical protein